MDTIAMPANQAFGEAFNPSGNTNAGVGGAGPAPNNLGNFYNFSLFDSNTSSASSAAANNHRTSSQQYQHPSQQQQQVVQQHSLNGIEAANMQQQHMLMAAAAFSVGPQQQAFVHGHPSQQQFMAANFARSQSHPHMAMQQQQHLYMNDPNVAMPGAAVNTGMADSSGEFDDSLNAQYDDDELLEMCDDPVMRERLLVVQQVQEAASCEGASGLFGCPYCDKQYAGKHARSIWRRHLQDKHSIPLSQQPRRTRWDGDINRPKNAEERRQRMLESKRRWARKKRLMDKAANAGGAGGAAQSPSDSVDQEEAENALQREADAEQAAAEANARIQAANAAQNAVANAAAAPATKKRTAGGGNGPRSRGMQQIKFHHLTTTDMPHHHSDAHNNGAITAVWNNANQKSGQSMAESSLASARGFAKHTSMPSRVLSRPVNVQQMNGNVGMMYQGVASPRRVLSEIDANRENDIRPASATSNKKIRYDLNGSMLMPAPGMNDMSAATPMNRFNSLYPTPPSTNDDKSSAAQVFGGVSRQRHHNGGPLSPPASLHHLDSSPSSVLASATRALNGRHNPSAMLSPVSSSKRGPHQSPAGNPFSLDQHKISPATSRTSSRVMLSGMEAPPSSSRLTGALKEEDRQSPLQTRLALWSDVDSSDMLAGMSASPAGKARKLPPLVKTPLRRGEKGEESGPTPGHAMSLLASGTSVRKSARFANAGNATTIGSATTPTRQQERLDKLFGGSMLGLTPFEGKNGGGASSKYSASRSGYFTRASPMKGGDQFSSPQHLNLTQSLGLAPHSVSKSGAGLHGGMNSLTGTPYINSFLSNSPWPDSVLRPTYRTSASKRGSPASGKDEDDEECKRGAKRSSSDDGDEEGDDEDDVHHHAAANETPSRPAKRPNSSLLGTGSPTQRQLRSSASRSAHQDGGMASQSVLGSSAGRSRRSFAVSSSRRPSELPPLSFKLSSPAGSTGAVTTDADENETTRSTSATSTSKKRNNAISPLSFDKELMQQDESPSASRLRSSKRRSNSSSSSGAGAHASSDD